MSWHKWPPWRKSVKEQARGAREERERERHQSILTAVNALTDEFRSERQRQAAENAKKASRDKWTTIGLFTTTGVALVTLLVSAWQAHLSQIAISDAGMANEIAQDTANRQLRAYVSVAKHHIKVTGRQVDAFVQFVNTGLTPAYDFSGFVCLYVGYLHEDANTMAVEKTFPSISVSPSNTMVGPRGGTKALYPRTFCGVDGKWMDRDLTDAELQRLKAGTAAIYLYGKMTYRDAFGPPQRWITFNFFSNAFVGAIGPNGEPLDVPNAQQGN